MKVCINITKNNNSSLGLGLGSGTAVNLVILKYNEQQAKHKYQMIIKGCIQQNKKYLWFPKFPIIQLDNTAIYDKQY